jgi:hypothetical protein
MDSIQKVVLKAIRLGYLTTEAEATICQLMSQLCNPAEVEALVVLQTAINLNQVKRLSQVGRDASER